MARTRRLIPHETALHIMCRGNNKQKIFIHDADKLYYYSLMLQLKKENSITVFHYCLMDNHVHLIVWLNSNSKISKFIKQLNLSYFYYYHKRYDYTGHLWQGRFKSNIVDSDAYLLQCGKYIELNPVRAGIVDLPEQYAFSSFLHYSKGKPDSVVTDDPVYLGLSSSEKERRKAYNDFVIDSNIINSIDLSKKLFIGSEAFVSKSEKGFGIRNTSLKRGRPNSIRIGK